MISVKMRGRLGNQMFQYSLCRTIAEKKGYDFYISKKKNEQFQNISDYFDIDMGIQTGKINHIRYEIGQQFQPTIFNIVYVELLQKNNAHVQKSC